MQHACMYGLWALWWLAGVQGRRVAQLWAVCCPYQSCLGEVCPDMPGDFHLNGYVGQACCATVVCRCTVACASGANRQKVVMDMAPIGDATAAHACKKLHVG